MGARALAGMAFIALISTASSTPAETLGIERVVPAGDDVPPARQLVISFDAPMVALGTSAPPPGRSGVHIHPRLDCEWRWLNPRTLACQLAPDARMAPATRYEVVIERGLTALDGRRLEQPHRHRFVTERPRMEGVTFRTWLGPGRPVLRVRFSQPVSHESVQRHLYLHHADSRPARREVTVAPVDRAGDAMLAGMPDDSERARAALLASASASRWLIAPKHALPLDSRIALNVEPGMLGEGPEPGIERRIALAFDTLPPFRFLGVRCSRVVDGRSQDIDADALARVRSCDPLAGVALRFSAPVATAAVARALTTEPPLAGERRDFDPWASASSHVYLSRAHARGDQYLVWLPVTLKAFTRYRLGTRDALRDAFRRPLSEPLAHDLLTAHRRPRLHVEHRQAVLESAIDSELPLYVTNLASIEARYRRLTIERTIDNQRQQIAIAPVEDVSFAVPLGVRRMLSGRSGVVSGELYPSPATRDGRIRFLAQVTPFAVTAKLGHFSSMAWVSELATGRPVADARVRISVGVPRRLDPLTTAALADGHTDANGRIRLPGLQVLDPNLRLVSGGSRNTPRLLLSVTKDADIALLPLAPTYRVWTRDVWPRARRRLGHLRAWGTTAQGIYRLGDVIDYKLYLRAQDTQGLTRIARREYRLRIIDPKGQRVGDDRVFTPSRFGATAGRLRVASNAAVGWYRFQVLVGEGHRPLQAFRVLVSDFTPAPFKISTELDGERFRPGDALTVHTRARLHAGGPYTGGVARVNVRLSSRAFESKHPAARGFRFGAGRHADARVVLDDRQPLDARGERMTRIELADGGIDHGVIEVESSVRDDRGKSVAARARAVFDALDRRVGVRTTRWLHTENEPAELELLVVTADGAPIAGVPIAVRFERLERYTARVKGAGNAYIARSETRWIDAGNCSARSLAGAARCTFTPTHAGRYRASATIADTSGRLHRSEAHLWVSGRSRVLWAEPASGALEIVPDKARYTVGQRARFLVKNPYPGAEALISVERYGVLRSFQQRFETSTPVIELDLLAEDAPGIYLSVTLLSARVAAPPPERGQLDLGKPALRVGYVRVPVEHPDGRLAVEVQSDRTRYEPRERVELSFRVRAPGSDAVPEVELAVVALDEAVFDLLIGGAKRFDPHAGFNRLESLDVLTYSLLTRLVGRQKFERKGAPTGGDGGTAPGVRDLFRYVGYWNPSLIVDGNGRAEASFTLPDNLTGWRVLAMAVTPGRAMGLGQTQFSASKDTELRPVMPNQLSEGDSVKAGFTVLNRTDRARRLTVTVSAEGSALDETLREQREIEIAPYARMPVWLDLPEARAGEIRLRARVGDELDEDATEHTLEVHPIRRLEHVAVHGELIAGESRSDSVEIPLAYPTAIHDDVGGLDVDLSTSLLDNLEGAFVYMRDYPYACWEQRLSKAVMASHFQRLEHHLDSELEWARSAGLPAATLADAARFQAPNGGMTYWNARNERVSPYLSAFTALAFNWLEDAGHTIPAQVRARLDDYLAKLLRRDDVPGFNDAGMAATVRAVALAALAPHGTLTSDDLARYAPHLTRMSLFGKAHFLQAALALSPPNPHGVSYAELYAARALDAILAHGDQSAGKLVFNESLGRAWQGMHSTRRRATCAVLSSVLAAERSPSLAGTLSNASSRIVRGIVADRGTRAHWENTQENLFCMQSLAEHAARAGTAAPDLEIDVTLDESALGNVRLRGFDATPRRLSRSIDRTDPGTERTLILRSRGQGTVYYRAQLGFARTIDAIREVNAGMTVRRELSVRRDDRWQLIDESSVLHRGDLVRVDLYLSVPGARHFVVVDDPVAAGLEPVDHNLETAARSDAPTDDGPANGHWRTRNTWRSFGHGFDGFYHRELTHRTVRFFADLLEAGDYRLSYTAQAIASGRFSVPPVRAEQMYDPDVFGLGLGQRLAVDD